MIFLYDRVENIVGKGENPGYQHFLLFPQSFQKASIPDPYKPGLVWERVKTLKKIDNFKKLRHAKPPRGNHDGKEGQVLAFLFYHVMVNG